MGGVLFLVKALPQSNTSTASSSGGCPSPVAYSGPTVDLLFIEDQGGINQSISHGAPTTPWPCISIPSGTTVNVTVKNLDPVETHGFAIDHYFDGGVSLRPGASYSFSFVTGQKGHYTIFCNVFCTIHVYMIGQLVVT